MAIDFRFWREKETPDSAQDPGWYFGHKEKSVQHITAATVQKEEVKTRSPEPNEQEEEAKGEASVVSSGPLTGETWILHKIQTGSSINW